MSYELIAILMFSSMMVLLLTGQRVFAAIGFVAAGAALLLYGNGGIEMPFSQAFKLFNWFPMLTLPLFIYMGYILAESGIAEDLYKMLHVWFGRFRGGLAIGTIVLMVIISAMNGLSVAGMAIGATIALPEMIRRGYDKVLITGVIQGGSSLGILVPPSVVMVLYGMIGVLGVRIWMENRVDFSHPINLTTAGVALVIGIADFTWVFGDVTFAGIALGTFAAVALFHTMRFAARTSGAVPDPLATADDVERREPKA